MTSRTLWGRWGALGALVLAVVLGASAADAHGFSPARLDLVALGGGRYASVWVVPLAGEGGEEGAEPIAVELPARCHAVTETAREPADLRVVHRRVIDCGPEGLRGATVRVRGLDAARIDAFVRVREGEDFTAVLRPGADSVTLPRGGSSWRATALRYGALGVEHILTGADHLLFVLGLVLLVPRRRALLGVVTAFTASHSVTLGLTAVGLLRVPQAPAEACIALSLAALARRLLRPADRVRPWAMAAGFGLLHGLGFAGALTSVGVPKGALPLALGAFNVGVELGQTAFVLALLAIAAVARAILPDRARDAVREALPWGIGALSMFWFLQRTLGEIP